MKFLRIQQNNRNKINNYLKPNQNIIERNQQKNNNENKKREYEIKLNMIIKLILSFMIVILIFLNMIRMKKIIIIKIYQK